MTAFVVVSVVLTLAGAVAGEIFGDALRPVLGKISPALAGATLVVIIAAAVAAQEHFDPSDEPTPQTSTTEPAASSPAPNEQTDSVADSDDAAGTDDPPTLMARALADFPQVDVGYDASQDLDDEGPFTAEGKSFGRGLIYSCQICLASEPKVRIVTLGRHYKRFTATPVVLDEAQGEYRITVTLDDQDPAVYSVKPGGARSICINTSGANRMRIELYSQYESKSPVQRGADAAGGVETGYPGVALGDPTVYPRGRC